jgi:hypothetical protein
MVGFAIAFRRLKPLKNRRTSGAKRAALPGPSSYRQASARANLKVSWAVRERFPALRRGIGLSAKWPRVFLSGLFQGGVSRLPVPIWRSRYVPR